MSELDAIFGGGAEHAHEQQAAEKILPAPAPIAAKAADEMADDHGVTIPPIGLPGEAVVYEPFRVNKPDDAESE